MLTGNETLIATLKAARLNKGLSQRALAARVGLPQSHISRIEAGAVDLRTSNLLELARALELELMLVPRSSMPVVRALERNQLPAVSEQRGVYALDDNEDDDEE